MAMFIIHNIICDYHIISDWILHGPQIEKQLLKNSVVIYSVTF